MRQTLRLFRHSDKGMLLLGGHSKGSFTLRWDSVTESKDGCGIVSVFRSGVWNGLG